MSVSWGTVIDQKACVGCHACTIACQTEFALPPGSARSVVKTVEVGTFPGVSRHYQVNRCNQCASAPCVTVCPTAALTQSGSGVVALNRSACVGCKACAAACPYDAIAVSALDGVADKCNLCAHRLEIGLEPACAAVCPTGAIQVADLAEPDSPLAALLGGGGVAVRGPELEAKPRVHYLGAHPATLDPLAAMRPPGGLFARTEQGEAPFPTGQGQPGTRLVYDVPRRIAWDWRVSLGVWSKGIAAGVYLVPMTLVMLGLMRDDGALWRLVTPTIALIYLGVTGALLTFELERRDRLRLLFVSPQPRSWLIRSLWVLIGFAAVLFLHFAASLVHVDLHTFLQVPGLVLALLTPVCTARLMGQCTGRALWQGPTVATRLMLQAILAGAAVILPFAAVLETDAATPITLGIALGCLLSVGLLVWEARNPPAGGPGAAAHRVLVQGPMKGFLWSGTGLIGVGLLAPLLGAWVSPLVLAGLLVAEHAFLVAGQSAPQA